MVNNYSSFEHDNFCHRRERRLATRYKKCNSWVYHHERSFCSQRGNTSDRSWLLSHVTCKNATIIINPTSKFVLHDFVSVISLTLKSDTDLNTSLINIHFSNPSLTHILAAILILWFSSILDEYSVWVTPESDLSFTLKKIKIYF